MRTYRPTRATASLGYTLTEMMLVVAIIGIVFVMAPTLLVNMTNFWRQTSARNDIERDVRVSLDIMDRMLRQAQQSTIVIDQVPGQPPWSRITFTTISGQTVSYYQTKNVLYTKSGTNVTALSRKLGYIAFAFPKTNDTSIVTVAITTQAPTYKGGFKALQLSIEKVRIMNP